MYADPNKAIFCHSVTLMFPSILSICFSMPSLTTSSAPMTTGAVCAFIPHIFAIFISRSLYLDSFSTTWVDVFDQMELHYSSAYMPFLVYP